MTKEQMVREYFAKHPTATIIRHFFVGDRLTLAYSETLEDGEVYTHEGPVIEYLEEETAFERVEYWVNVLREIFGMEPLE